MNIDIDVKVKYQCGDIVLDVCVAGSDRPFIQINLRDVIVGSTQELLDERRRIYYNERENLNNITDALRKIAEEHNKVAGKIWNRHYF
jgi:hypothetical protein